MISVYDKSSFFRFSFTFFVFGTVIFFIMIGRVLIRFFKKPSSRVFKFEKKTSLNRFWFQLLNRFFLGFL